MDRKALLDDLYKYETSFHEEKLFVSSFIELIEKNNNCFDRSLLTGHITGSAWILNPTFSKTLLIYHAKLKKWLQPGGHTDGDENVIHVAGKELEEETGISTAELFTDNIFDLDIHRIPEYGNVSEHLHFDIRYLFIVPDSTELAPNNESLDIKWVELNKVTELAGIDNSIMRIVRKSINLAKLSNIH